MERVSIAQVQHQEEQDVDAEAHEAFRAQLRGGRALHAADSFAVALLERQLADRASRESTGHRESNRLYEEEAGLLRDALPSGIFGHVGSFVRGLGTGVAAGAFISKL